MPHFAYEHFLKGFKTFSVNSQLTIKIQSKMTNSLKYYFPLSSADFLKWKKGIIIIGMFYASSVYNLEAPVRQYDEPNLTES